MNIFDIPAVSTAALTGVSITALLLVLSHNWRWSILVIGAQYVGIFILTAASLPLEMAATKLVAGWMAAAVLGMAMSEALAADPGSWREAERAWPSSRLFRLLAACLVVLTGISISPKIASWMPGIAVEQATGGVMLIGMGLLHLGLTSQPLRVVIGLLTTLAGFELFYAAVEDSSLVAGLLAAVNLSLALIGAYMLLAPTIEETA